MGPRYHPKTIIGIHEIEKLRTECIVQRTRNIYKAKIIAIKVNIFIDEKGLSIGKRNFLIFFSIFTNLIRILSILIDLTNLLLN